MSSQVISYRLSDEELSALKPYQLRGDSQPTRRIYAPHDMQHAVALTKSALVSILSSDGIPF